ncbi:hypothetical protein B0T26DRAFT_873589 [Lasiosphaeria miniovina]|uniref:Uncharacterized protein n=1 Tax=Lasiosphaeria miniovina TaxID=1954250 RepID=A0AA40ACQ5_9PEZI|nr:uncharacterized protein B0T26DRAFT_873589 [Lasiosphaeria miniovina]KAK0713426.1 hypothetical protein B0T26DRAFT_873589 [Lasiosphaeria miniovina]
MANLKQFFTILLASTASAAQLPRDAAKSTPAGPCPPASDGTCKLVLELSDQDDGTRRASLYSEECDLIGSVDHLVWDQVAVMSVAAGQAEWSLKILPKYFKLGRAEPQDHTEFWWGHGRAAPDWELWSYDTEDAWVSYVNFNCWETDGEIGTSGALRTTGVQRALLAGFLGVASKSNMSNTNSKDADVASLAGSEAPLLKDNTTTEAKKRPTLFGRKSSSKTAQAAPSSSTITTTTTTTTTDTISSLFDKYPNMTSKTSFP